MTGSHVSIDALPEARLRGSVKLYGRHILACTGHTGWPAHIETMGGFVGALAAAIEARSPEIPWKVKFTACDEPSRSGGTDLLVFPDGIRYLGLNVVDIPLLVEQHLVAGAAPAQLAHTPLEGQFVFVCAHAARDVRCGACGPGLHDRFVAELAERGLTERVQVRASSHVGGHQYAGNVLVYPHGDWYGYVQPSDVPTIISEHLLGGRVVGKLWRGRMGLSPEQQHGEAI